MLRQKFSAYEMIDENENLPKSLSDKQIRKKNGTSINGRYLPLLPRSKKNTYQNRMGAFAYMMQKHYRVQILLSNRASSLNTKTSPKPTFKRKKESNHKKAQIRCSPPKKRRTEQSDRLAQDLPSIAVQKESSDPKKSESKTLPAQQDDVIVPSSPESRSNQCECTQGKGDICRVSHRMTQLSLPARLLS